MKKLGLFAIAVAMVIGTSTQASAFSLANNYEGPVSFKFTDFSTGNLYQTSSNGYGQANTTEDAWGIFKITSIKSNDLNVDTLWFDGKDGEQLTGIYYGIDDDFWSVDPLTGSLNIQSVGGRIDIYLDSATSFNANPGPVARIDTDEYPTVTDGELFLSLEFATGIKFGDLDPNNDHIVYNNDLNATTTPFVGGGAFYLNVLGGSQASLFNHDAWCITDDSGDQVCQDFFGQFATTTEGSGSWLVKSDDPINGIAREGNVIPEPATMLMLGSSLFGIALRRRNKA